MIIVQIAGRLGRKPETRFTPSGQKVTSFSVATKVRKAGKEETVWWRVTVWGDRYDKMMTYLDKGSAVIVIGEMNKPETWTDKEGKQQLTLELTAEIIKFSPFGNPDRPAQEQGTSSQSPQSSNNFSSFGSEGEGSEFGGAVRGNAGYAFQEGKAPQSQFNQNDEPLPF